MAFALIALLGVVQLQSVLAINYLTANTTSGQVHGFVNETTPNVAHFLGIPFAEAPIGARRWLPAEPKSKEDGIINATQFGPSCPQWENEVERTVYSVDTPNFNPTPFDYQSEDCLSLNIWAPYHGINVTQPLPVLLWLYGGGFGAGGGNVPYQNPAPWVEKSGKHVVVSIKCVCNKASYFGVVLTVTAIAYGSSVFLMLQA
jgi:acetylcholinesterase